MHKALCPHVRCINFPSYKSVTVIIVILFYFVKKLLFKHKIPLMFYCLDIKVMFLYHAIVSNCRFTNSWCIGLVCWYLSYVGPLSYQRSQPPSTSSLPLLNRKQKKTVACAKLCYITLTLRRLMSYIYIYIYIYTHIYIYIYIYIYTYIWSTHSWCF